MIRHRYDIEINIAEGSRQMRAKIKQIKTSLKNIIVVTGLLLATVSPLVPQHASAAMTSSYLKLDRMKASTATTGTVCAKVNPATPTEAGVRVTFPTGFTVSGTAANWAVGTANLPAGATAWTGIAAPSADGDISGQSVNFNSGNLASTTNLYCFNWTNTAALSTSTAGANKTGTIATCTTYATCSGTIADSSNYATAVIAEDQITVSATVSATFNFALSGTTDALSTLSTSSVTSSPTPRTVTITTNATNGYLSWIKDSNAGLVSTLGSDTINTSGTVDDACSGAYSSGNEFYGLDADETTDPNTNGSIDVEYDCSATTVGAYQSTSFTELATGTGPTSGYVITLNNRAAASTTNAAATDYADTITVVGAGNF